MFEASVLAMADHELISAHGEKLVSRIPDRDACSEYERQAVNHPEVVLDSALQSDLLLLGTGAFSPLEGFMGERDYFSVLHKMRLANDVPWSLPVVLPVGTEQARAINEGHRIALTDLDGQVLGILDVTETFQRDKHAEARSVYGTDDLSHPGVARVFEQGDVLLAGPVWLIQRPAHGFPDYERDPVDVRRMIAERGWKTVVGFQTRNPLHRGHEYLIKCVLEIFDGVLLHPLVGPTRSEDVPSDIRMACYETVLENYLPSDRVILSAFPATMRYAGPREAIFHALVRKNYGCTHFIVGRDHAGVNGFYPPDAARKIFHESRLELGVQPLFFDSIFYCPQCAHMASEKTCPHDPKARVFPSGTQLRNALRAGEKIPQEWTRPEVAEILQKFYQKERIAS